MKDRRIIVVGGFAAGPSAAAKAKRVNPHAEVTIFEASETISYGICEAPYAISGLIDNEEKLVIFSPERFENEKSVNVKTLHLVEKIIPSKHKVVVRDLKSRQTFEYAYDKLILATGSYARKLNVDGENGRNVFHLKNREDTQTLIHFLQSEKPKQAVIIGGGYIGMEMAESLRSRGIEVTILHQSNLPMEGLEKETRERILEELQKNEIQFIPNIKVEALQQDSTGRVNYIITNKGSFEADIVILSLGVAPNVDLAIKTNIRLGSTGGIITDERQRTNIEDIYAAGDCCEVKNIVSEKPAYLPLATIAARTGSAAGENAGGGRALFKGAIRSLAVKIFDLEIAQIGLGFEEAKDFNFKVADAIIHSATKVEIMTDKQKISIKLIFDKRTKRVLGANIYGGSGSALRANTLAIAIQHKLTLDDLASLDLIYAPPFSPLWDPILIAANQAKKK